MHALQFLIIPMLEKSFKAGETSSILDEEIIGRIVRDLLVFRGLNATDEYLSAELLQLSILVMQYMPNECQQHRKDLISLGWNHLKKDNITARNWAFLSVSR